MENNAFYLRWMAALADAGVPRGRIEELVGRRLELDVPLEGRRLGRHLTDLAQWEESRSQARTRIRFRRNWWRGLLWWSAAGLVLSSVLTRAMFGPMFESMSLMLPWPTRCLLQHHGWLPPALLLLAALGPYRRNSEDLLETDLDHCVGLRSRLSAGVPYHEAATERVSQPLSALLAHGRLNGRVYHLAGLWARGVEWDLGWRSRGRGWRVWLLPGLLAGLCAWTLLGWTAPFNQLIGCL